MIGQSALTTLCASNGKTSSPFIFFPLWKIQQLNGKVERKEKEGSRKEISCPQSIVNYNKYMGFVDNFDHLKCLYEIDSKSQK